MTLVVVDASAAIGWLLASQATEISQAFLADRIDLFLIAPFVFEWEVKNVILTMSRSGRIDGGDEKALLAQFDDFAIELQPPEAASAVLPLARRERLSLFDAAYLKTALDVGAALASRDQSLLIAAVRNGLQVFDLSGEAA